MLSTGLRNLCMALAFATGCAAAEPVTVIALGDSLTQGYGLPEGEGLVPQLQQWLASQGEDAVVVNAGVSGDTTAGGASRIDWALTPEADAVIVTLGGNDLLRGLPPEEARANLEAILSTIRQRGLPVLLIGMKAPGNYGPDYKAAFDAVHPDLAADFGALLIEDFLAPLREPADTGATLRDYLQADGLHPNAAGVALIVQAIGPRVRELIAQARER